MADAGCRPWVAFASLSCFLSALAGYLKQAWSRMDAPLAPDEVAELGFLSGQELDQVLGLLAGRATAPIWEQGGNKAASGCFRGPPP